MVLESNLFGVLNYKPRKPKLYSGYIMNKDDKVARIDNNQVTEILISKLCPFYLLRTKDFEGWVISRTIDSHRPNSRILRKMLRLKNPESLEVAMRSRCRTITDSFWFKEGNDDLTFEDLVFKDDLLKDVALHGRFDSLEINQDVFTPELTNIGSYEKSWVLDSQSNWWLRKIANDKELFSEIFTSMLSNHLGYDAVPYYRVGDSNVIECENFVKDGYWFEPMFSILGDEEDYEYNYSVLSNITGVGDLLVMDYLKILFVDALVQNPDRHTNNYGVLVRDGNIIKMAPNFDNNLALIAKGFPRTMPTIKNPLIRDFVDLVNSKNLYFKVPELSEEDLRMLGYACVMSNRINSISRTNVDSIARFVYNNYKIIKENLEGYK